MPTTNQTPALNFVVLTADGFDLGPLNQTDAKTHASDVDGWVMYCEPSLQNAFETALNDARCDGEITKGKARKLLAQVVDGASQ